MDETDQNADETLQRWQHAKTKLRHHERLTNIILGCLTFSSVLALGLLIGHIVGVPWLSH
jgi:hypothetical protein